MSEKTITLTPLELSELVKTATKEAVAETLTALGIDVTKPQEVQKDMTWLRTWRENSDDATTTAIRTVVGVIIAGTCGLVWMALHK